MAINSSLLARGSVLALVALCLPLAAEAASLDGTYKGAGTTQGGSKPFCKGKTSFKATVAGGVLHITLPMASGGQAAISGKINASGAFGASGDEFKFTGTFKGGKASGSWKGPSCFGSFTLTK